MPNHGFESSLRERCVGVAMAKRKNRTNRVKNARLIPCIGRDKRYIPDTPVPGGIVLKAGVVSERDLFALPATIYASTLVRGVNGEARLRTSGDVFQAERVISATLGVF